MPDPKKSRYVAISCAPAAPTEPYESGKLLAFAKERGATEMMVPAEIYAIDKMPLQGSGKVDFVQSRALAETLSQGS